MALLAILTLPVAPLRLVTALGRLMQQEAYRQRYSSAGVRQRLEALDSALASGELTERERDEAQRAIVQELIVRSSPGDGEGN